MEFNPETAPRVTNPQEVFDRIDAISAQLEAHEKGEATLSDAEVEALKEEKYKLNEDLISRRS